MPAGKIILEIKEDGSIQYEVSGVKGAVCTKKVDWLDKLLGGVKSRIFKKEYHEHALIVENTK